MRFHTPNMVKLHRGTKNREKENVVVKKAREAWSRIFYKKRNLPLKTTTNRQNSKNTPKLEHKTACFLAENAKVFKRKKGFQIL